MCVKVTLGPAVCVCFLFSRKLTSQQGYYIAYNNEIELKGMLFWVHFCISKKGILFVGLWYWCILQFDNLELCKLAIGSRQRYPFISYMSHWGKAVRRNLITWCPICFLWWFMMVLKRSCDPIGCHDSLTFFCQWIRFLTFSESIQKRFDKSACGVYFNWSEAHSFKNSSTSVTGSGCAAVEWKKQAGHAPAVMI